MVNALLFKNWIKDYLPLNYWWKLCDATAVISVSTVLLLFPHPSLQVPSPHWRKSDFLNCLSMVMSLLRKAFQLLPFALLKTKNSLRRIVKCFMLCHQLTSVHSHPLLPSCAPAGLWALDISLLWTFHRLLVYLSGVPQALEAPRVTRSYSLSWPQPSCCLPFHLLRDLLQTRT